MSGVCLVTNGYIGERRKKIFFNKFDEGFACHTILGTGPGAPLERERDGRLVCAFFKYFKLLLAIVEDLEEEEPCDLLHALGIARHVVVVAHDVPDILDESVGDHINGLW